jgi:hypothetical protein
VTFNLQRHLKISQLMRRAAWDRDFAEWFYDSQEEAIRGTLAQYKKLRRQRKYQPWTVVPAAKLIKIWTDFGRTGVVRDEEGLNEIAWTITDNIFKLYANTLLCGHTPHSYDEYLKEAGINKAKFENETDDWFTDPVSGHWRLSDYGLEPLLNLIPKIKNASKPEDKLFALDRVFNIIHQRSDLSAMFVQGGNSTLQKIFDYRPPQKFVLKYHAPGYPPNTPPPRGMLQELSQLPGISVTNQNGSLVDVVAPENVLQDWIRGQWRERGNPWQIIAQSRNPFLRFAHRQGNQNQPIE